MSKVKKKCKRQMVKKQEFVKCIKKHKTADYVIKIDRDILNNQYKNVKQLNMPTVVTLKF